VTGTFSRGLDGALKDFRQRNVPRELPLHVLGARRGDVLHMCPECGLTPPRPFCGCCLGAGLVTAEKLHAWCYRQNTIDHL
jgi:hypothetical protein